MLTQRIRHRVLCFSEEQAILDQKFSRLKGWIVNNGGLVHDSLRLHRYEKPPFLSTPQSALYPTALPLCRSLRTRYAIDTDEVLQPCIGLPSSIIVDRKMALGELEDVLSSAGCPPLYARPTVEIIAVFIAYHRQQGLETDISPSHSTRLFIGEASKWYPAISSLPEQPPCPWLKQTRDLIELEYDEELQDTIQKERSGNDLIIKQLHALYGQFLGLSKVDLLWAYGQAQAISFHEPDGSFWPPLVHFLQHDRSQPPLYMHEQGRFVNWGWQDRIVPAGEHLRINIGMSNPLLLYLSRGIVSADL